MCLWVLLCLTVARRWPHFLNSYQSWCTFLIILPVLLPCLFFYVCFLSYSYRFLFCFLLDDTLIFVWRLFCSFSRTISLHVYWLFFVRFSLSVLPPLPSYCRCYSYYVLFLRVMKFLLVLYNIAIYFTDCFASVFTALWVCKCVPNLLISVFLFSCSVYLYYILFLYSIKHDYDHCSFCLYWFAFAFLQYQQHMVYFTSLFINTFLFSISHSPLAVSNLMRFSLVLWVFLSHCNDTRCEVCKCVCLWKGQMGLLGVNVWVYRMKLVCVCVYVTVFYFCI